MTENTKVLTPKILLMVIIFIVIVPLLPLLISWNWGWWEAWIYFAFSFLGFIISRYLAGRKHPDLIRERGKYLDHDNPEHWDRKLSPLLGIVGAAIPIAAGLDGRFGPSADFGWVIKGIAIFLMLASNALGTAAMMANRFFSGMVRLQTDRGHHVISGGPYRWVRHPGYLGALLTYAAVPFLMDSWWTLIPAFLSFLVIVIRTRLEDDFLQKSLDGYKDFTQKVRYRLFPGIW
jgi:protein-S-isoprenylcysteine O-methyltransferase Ste14